jgi:hypothetical protein
VKFVDDIDGSEASETVSFGLDGRQYDIDLSTRHAQQLRDTMATFVAAARRGGGRRSPAPRGPRPATNREETLAIREWARANGQDIADRGRIPKAVTEAYANRHNAPPAIVEAATAVPKKKARKRSEKVAS